MLGGGGDQTRPAESLRKPGPNDMQGTQKESMESEEERPGTCAGGNKEKKTTKDGTSWGDCASGLQTWGGEQRRPETEISRANECSHAVTLLPHGPTSVSPACYTTCELSLTSMRPSS